MFEKLLLKNFQSVGDVLMLTAAVRDLKAAYPHDYEIHVNTAHAELWQGNPNVIIQQISPHGTVEGMRSVACHYPAINQSNRLPRHFVEAFHRYLEIVLNKPIPVREFKGDVYLTQKEKNEYPILDPGGKPRRYWVVVNGGKTDFSAKWPIPAKIERALENVDKTLGIGKMKWVQIGAAAHIHPRLKNKHAIDLVGQTSIRDVLQLIYHSDGVLCPVTFAMHACAAIPAKTPPFVFKEELGPTVPENLRPGAPLRPCVVIAGGREPAHWERYPGMRFLENVGSLPCCSYGGCWRSRAHKIGDGDGKDKDHLCLNPVQYGDWTYAKCIDMISSKMISKSILDYYEGGSLSRP
jgi:ADP-heptose:LPS heptosyltransferase